MLLYKYCDARGIDILSKLRIKATPPLYFNDPFEFTPEMVGHLTLERARQTVWEDEGILRELHSSLRRDGFPGNFPDFLTYLKNMGDSSAEYLVENYSEDCANFRRNYLANVSTKFGIVCLSGVHDEILMWSHYADRHTGFVVAFDSNLLVESGITMYEVEYNEKRVPVDWSLKASDPNFSEQAVALARRKSRHWSYELEWRLILLLEECVPEQDERKVTNYYAEINAELIQAVYMGCRCTPSLSRAIFDELRKPSLSHVTIYRAHPHESDFKLSVEEISRKSKEWLET